MVFSSLVSTNINSTWIYNGKTKVEEITMSTNADDDIIMPYFAKADISKNLQSSDSVYEAMSSIFTIP